MNKKTTVLMILDGFGLSDEVKGNAIALAHTPRLDAFMRKYPFKQGRASGLDVGLPDGQMGNSEVGHTNIGAGRVVYQELTRITKAIQDGDFFQNPALLQAMENVKQHQSALHIYGLLSDGGVHSHNTHLYALLKMAKAHGLTAVYVHAFLDGRDTPPTSGLDYIRQLEAEAREIGVGQVASISGRYYAMDRDNRWDRVEKAYKALTEGQGATAESAVACMEKTYADGVNDEFVVPTVITCDGKPLATVQDHDSIVFFNFRPDRAREITRAFCAPDFTGFSRARHFHQEENAFPLCYVCFAEYDEKIPNKLVAFHNQSMENTLGQYLADKGLTQLRLAETEKYAHVTFFFNGGVEAPYKGEDRILVPSPKVATYDLQPEMSARLVTDKLVAAIVSLRYDLIIINYANPDMVGHTGVLDAAIKAIEVVDECVGDVVDALLSVSARLFLCADHGNADKMIDEKTGEPFTAHTTNPVPFLLINVPGADLADGGRLCDIAPTLLEIMELEQPAEMTGHSLLIRR